MLQALSVYRNFHCCMILTF